MNTSGTGISALVERQMRAWELARERSRKEGEAPCAKPVKFYIAISRECGASDDAIVPLVVERTGFQKFDKEILNYMAGEDDIRHKLYETLDDRTVGWIEDVASSLTFGPAVGQVEYFKRLSRALLAICHNTHAIILGRGANFVLPRACGLAVRLVAPEDYRLERYAKATGLDAKEAKREMRKVDASRSQFIETHFGKYAYDPRRYDLVVNVAQFGVVEAADLIVHAARAKAGEELRLPVESST
ncbi:MAG: cytidylate kinase-like family protein [Phycisphaerae bacterium]|nr:cytidylate kinase-like family protein [Phycisphaerae bacterium]